MRTGSRLRAALVLLVLGTSGSASIQAADGGPFVCTEVIGLMTTGEWYNAGFQPPSAPSSAPNGRAASRTTVT